MEESSKGVFYNESLALPYDDGISPIKIHEIVSCCDNDFHMGEDMPHNKQHKAVMGIDYGPVNSEKSHTLITIIQIVGDKVRVVYVKKFIGKEADYSFIHRKVPELMKKFGVHTLAADYGMGEAPNSEIRNRIGYERVVAFQHMPAQKDNIKWNASMPAYTLNRNFVMNGFFELIKSGKVSFPCYEDFKPFIEDILNIQVEYDEERGTSKYINIGPDDFVHATIFALLSAQMSSGIKLIL